VEYAVYVAVPPGEDCAGIVRGARVAAPKKFDFKVRGKGDPSESTDIELCFRIRGVTLPEEALSQALRIYELARDEAGLKPDRAPRASLAAD